MTGTSCPNGKDGIGLTGRGDFFFFFVGEGRASQNEIKATKGAEINTDNKSNETGVLVATECDLVGGMIDDISQG